MNETIETAVARARKVLDSTSHFEELGLNMAAADARMCAHDVLDLVAHLEAERSARITLQARLEECQELLGERAFDATRTAEAAAEFETFDFGPGPSA
jgi:hypothetical protein